MMPRLTPELRAAVEQRQGGPIRVEAEGAAFILMSIDAYRSMMGVSSDADLADSLAAIQRGMDDVRAGRTRPAREALDDISARYGISR